MRFFVGCSHLFNSKQCLRFGEGLPELEELPELERASDSNPFQIVEAPQTASVSEPEEDPDSEEIHQASTVPELRGTLPTGEAPLNSDTLRSEATSPEATTTSTAPLDANDVILSDSSSS